MSNDFNNRMNAQRELLKIVNTVGWEAEPLLALSRGAIDRWIAVNRLAQDDRVVKVVRRAADSLYFLANKSQEQVSTEYQRASTDFSAIIEQAKHVIVSA